jgi:uncharacterized C2H2 Zn-finger protein
MQNNEPKIPQCFVCHTTFENFKELAKHVVKYSDTHGRSLKWAAKVLTDVERLNKKQDFQGRLALTDEQKEARKETVRQISGEMITQMCLCPHCNSRFPKKIEIEHVQNPTAWRQNKYLMLLCFSCESSKR